LFNDYQHNCHEMAPDRYPCELKLKWWTAIIKMENNLANSSLLKYLNSGLK
jgi:hypothetical protein